MTSGAPRAANQCAKEERIFFSQKMLRPMPPADLAQPLVLKLYVHVMFPARK